MHSDPSGYSPVIAGIVFVGVAALLLVTSISYILNIGGFRTAVTNAIKWALDKMVTEASSILKNFAKVGKWGAGKIASMLLIYIASAEKALPGIARKYGNFQCDKARDAMKAYLKKMNLHGSIITIQYPSKPGYVYSKSKNKNISQNGLHIGILFKGRVYCNVHPYGLSKNKWINDFEGVGTRTIREVPF